MLLACFVVAGQDGGGPARRTPDAGIPANRTFRPVTDAMLEKPDDSDWINWRRTYDGTGYSPLKQINKNNVGQLQMVWAWGLAPGRASRHRSCTTASCSFRARAAACRRSMPSAANRCGNIARPRRTGNGEVRNTPTRNIAIYGSNIYVATGDARLIALDARTGRTVWDTQVYDAKLGYTYTPVRSRSKAC